MRGERKRMKELTETVYIHFSFSFRYFSLKFSSSDLSCLFSAVSWRDNHMAKHHTPHTLAYVHIA